MCPSTIYPLLLLKWSSHVISNDVSTGYLSIEGRARQDDSFSSGIIISLWTIFAGSRTDATCRVFNS